MLRMKMLSLHADDKAVERGKKWYFLIIYLGVPQTNSKCIKF